LAAVFLSEAMAARWSKTVPDFVCIAKRTLPSESKALDDFIASLPTTAKEIAFGAGKSEAPLVGFPQKDQFPVVQSSRRSGSKSVTGEDFSLLAAHAGLILLHPFLPRFFASTNIKEETGSGLSPFALSRAAALLHLLATGHDDIYEYDLAFIKVLLGVNSETSLCVCEGLIVDTDMKETETLLQSVITHWTVLKNTSIAGFRSSFLDRPALLQEDDNGWRMRVDRRPYDVLLDHLPWSISVVKLPWMKRPLYTEW
jgi:Contractile injection system tape measure protein